MADITSELAAGFISESVADFKSEWAADFRRNPHAEAQTRSKLHNPHPNSARFRCADTSAEKARRIFDHLSTNYPQNPKCVVTKFCWASRAPHASAKLHRRCTATLLKQCRYIERSRS